MPAGEIELRNDKASREAAEKELKHRRTMIDQALKYYEGDQKKNLEEADANVTDNLCCEVIDGTAAFLVPDMPAIVVPGDEMLTDWLREAWESNDGAALLIDMATNGGIAGHNYSRVALMDDAMYPIVRGLDARNWLTWWREDDYKTRLWFESQSGRMSGTEDSKYRQDVLPDGGGWLIVDYRRAGTGWQATGEARWDYPLSPVVDWQHLPKAGYKYYGQSELPKHMISLQDHINKIGSDISEIIRYHAYPQGYATGVREQEVDAWATSPDSFMFTENEAAKFGNLEMQSDLVASRAERDGLKAAFFAKGRVVKLPGDLNAFRGVTNLGIRTLYMPQTAKAESLKNKYGHGLIEISRRMLMLAGLDYENEITVEWGSALPTDERESLTIHQMELGMGVTSRRRVAAMRGRNYDEVRRELIQEAADEDLIGTGGVVTGVLN